MGSLIVVLCLAYPAYVFIWADKPAVSFSYCTDVIATGSHGCSQTTTYEVPAIFFGRPEQNKRDKTQPKDILVAFPSMRAWGSLSADEQREQWKIEIELTGVTDPMPADAFRSMAFGTNEYSLENSVYGLESYSLKNQFSQVLLASQKNRYLTINCPNATTGQEAQKFWCRANTYLAFKSTARPDDLDQIGMSDPPIRKVLLVKYRYQRGLLPQWKLVQRNVNALIQAFEQK